MENQFNYVTRLDVKFSHLQRMDVTEMVKDCTDKWFNQTLSLVNESVVRLGIVEGEYHWHKHDNDDEFYDAIDDPQTIGVFRVPYVLLFNKNRRIFHHER